MQGKLIKSILKKVFLPVGILIVASEVYVLVYDKLQYFLGDAIEALDGLSPFETTAGAAMPPWPSVPTTSIEISLRPALRQGVCGPYSCQ